MIRCHFNVKIQFFNVRIAKIGNLGCRCAEKTTPRRLDFRLLEGEKLKCAAKIGITDRTGAVLEYGNPVLETLLLHQGSQHLH